MILIYVIKQDLLFVTMGKNRNKPSKKSRKVIDDIVAEVISSSKNAAGLSGQIAGFNGEEKVGINYSA